jgi:hypothetical protein
MSDHTDAWRPLGEVSGEIVDKLKEQARRLGHSYPHLLETDYDVEDYHDAPDKPGTFRELLRQHSYEIRNGEAHRRVEAEMLANMKRK